MWPLYGKQLVDAFMALGNFEMPECISPAEAAVQPGGFANMSCLCGNEPIEVAEGNKLLLTRKKYEEALAKAEASKHSGIAGAASLDSLRKTRELIDTCERVGGEFAVEGSVEQQELVQVLEAHEAFRPDFGTPQPVLRLRLLTCCVCLTRHSCWCSLL